MVSQKNKPFFTIAIPVVKTEFFEETLNSAINQTFEDYEIVVLNNASSSNIKHEIKKIVGSSNSRFPIKYFENDVQIPMVENWNRCIELSTGDYFCLLSDDDLIQPDYLLEIKRLILKYHSVDIFHTRVALINENGEIERITPICPEYEDGLDFLYYRVLGHRMFYVSDFVIRRKSLLEIGGFFDIPDGWGSDDLTWFNLSIKTGIVYTQKVLYHYRVSNVNITNAGKIKNKFNAINIQYKSIFEIIEKNNNENFRVVKIKMINLVMEHYKEKRKAAVVQKYLNQRYMLPHLLSQIIAIFFRFIIRLKGKISL